MDSSGHLCLQKELDRERQPFFNLTVMANDCARPVSSQLTSTAHVFIAVKDVNDNAPHFVSSRRVYVPEDATLHSVVMTVRAEDEDTGSNGEILYYLSNTSVFSINNTCGEIYLEQILDRELVETLSLTVTATDKGSPQMASTMNVTVHVEDVNDNDPELSQSNYSLSVREDIPRGTTLLQVQAHDQDVGPNGQVRYMLIPVGPFVVDTIRGVVSVRDRLDREKVPNYTLIIAAVDQGNEPRSATGTINITVLDINDSAPQFVPETLIIHVKENEEEPVQLTHQVTLCSSRADVYW